MSFGKAFFFYALFALTFATGPVHAIDTPETVEGFKIATAADVQRIQEGGGMVIDARVASESAEERIKGAIAIPYRELSVKAVDFDFHRDEFDLSKLPSDKAKPIVFYCNGVYCWKSYKAAAAAVRSGHENVSWYRQGMDDWKAKNLPME